MWQDDVFQVDRYEIVIEVRPTPKEEVRVRHGAKQRLVRCDNRAEIRRAGSLRPQQCLLRPLYACAMRRAVKGSSIPRYISLPLNEASPAELGRYDDHGKEVTWRFTPRPGSAYSQSFTVLGGFPPGERNAHFHLHDKTRYESVVVTLDLRHYIEQGYPVTAGSAPSLSSGRSARPQPLPAAWPRPCGEALPRRTGKVGMADFPRQPRRDRCGLGCRWSRKAVRAGDPDEERRQQLVRENVTACQVFEVVMRIMERKSAPVSFRQVKTLAEGIVPKTGIGSDLPLSQPQISRYISDVEDMLQEGVFFGYSVLLFDREPGRASMPTPAARTAVELIRHYLAKMDLD